MNILLTCAGRRHYLVNYFREALDGNGLLVGVDMDLTAPALAACDLSYSVPSINAPDYIEQIIKIIINNNIKMVFPLNDLEIGLFSANRTRIEVETSASVFVADQDTIRMCADKWHTFLFSKECGIPTIPTFLSPDEALLAVRLKKTKFPLMVKPRWGSASIGLQVVENERDLQDAFSACSVTVSQSALAQLGTDDAVIIQQLIIGAEYGADILFDEQCEYQGFTVKRKLSMRFGETDKAVTVDNERFESIVKGMIKSLNVRGNLDCDFLEQNEKIYLLEMNPRFGGGYPFTHEAGANHVRRLVDLANKIRPPEYKYKVGLAFAKCDRLVSVPVPLKQLK